MFADRFFYNQKNKPRLKESKLFRTAPFFIALFFYAYAAAEIRLSGDIAFMIDAGPLPPSPPSTVVKVGTDGSVTVLREGAIAGEGVFRFLGSDRSPPGQHH